MISCTKCGAQNNDDARFCCGCGTAIEKTEQFSGNNNANAVPFCAHCGTQLTDENLINHNGVSLCRNCGCVAVLPDYFKQRIKTYNDAVDEMNAAATESQFEDVGNVFRSLEGFRNSEKLAAQCFENAELCRKNDIYSQGKHNMLMGYYGDAIKLFESIPGFEDADEQIIVCQNKIEEIKAKKEAARIEAERRAEEKRIAAQKRRKVFGIVSAVICAVLAVTLLITQVIIPSIKYNKANDNLESGKYDEAFAGFTELGNFKDSCEKMKESGLNYAEELAEDSQYSAAVFVLDYVGDYNNSFELRDSCYLELAKADLEKGSYNDALENYQSIRGYDTTSELYYKICYNYAKTLADDGNYTGAIKWFEKCGNYSDAADQKLAAQYNYAKSLYDNGNYRGAAQEFEKCGDYIDAEDQLLAAQYAYVNVCRNNSNTFTYECLKNLKANYYKDSAEIFDELYTWKVTVTAINSSQYDESTNYSTLVGLRPVYFHYKLTGGEPNEKIIVNFTIYYLDGDTDDGNSSWEMWDGATNYVGWSTGPYSRMSHGTAGDFAIRFYDDEWNTIGYASVQLTSYY